LAKHNEEGITNSSNCTPCHKNGNEHNIEMKGNSTRDEEKSTMNEYMKGAKR
jgi:hypothetical protein